MPPWERRPPALGGVFIFCVVREQVDVAPREGGATESTASSLGGGLDPSLTCCIIRGGGPAPPLTCSIIPRGGVLGPPHLEEFLVLDRLSNTGNKDWKNSAIRGAARLPLVRTDSPAGGYVYWPSGSLRRQSLADDPTRHNRAGDLIN
mgnify:CR=1 FL=1